MYEDKTLVCKECGNEFVFTAGEQEFYAEIQQLVLLAAARLLFLSSQERTDLFTAASVSLR